MKDIKEDILLEWRFRHKDGNPQTDDADDMKLLYEIIAESGTVIEPTQIEDSDIVKLKNAIEQIKDTYAKYLAVFYYFDANSLGTISESLLAKLLNKLTDINAVHTGQQSGLADLVVNGIPISLKTTSASEYINLGEDSIRMPSGESERTSKAITQLLNIENPKGELDSKTKIKDVISDRSKFTPEIKKSISNRVDAVARKLAGEKEKFIWIEKLYKGDRVLKQLNIHIADYDFDEVKDVLLNSYLYITPKGWGMKDEAGRVLIRSHSKLEMSLAPHFVRKTTKKELIEIPLPIKDFTDLKAKRAEISDKLFNSLDEIYASLT